MRAVNSAQKNSKHDNRQKEQVLEYNTKDATTCKVMHQGYQKI